MNILITGANGFIGHKTAQHFILKDHQVIGTGRSNSIYNHANYRYLRADITNPEDCDHITREIDIIIHCAGKAGVWGEYEDYELTNIIGTKNLLEAGKKNGVKRFINISSPSIYFQFKNQFQIKESLVPIKFSNAYAETKYKAEQLVQLAHSEDFATVSLRPRGVIGAGDRNWLPRIINMRKENKLIQPGNGQNLVDFTSVSNLIEVIKTCTTISTHKLGTSYNISNDKPEFLWKFIENALYSVNLDGKRKKIPKFLAMNIAKISSFYHKLQNTKHEPDILPVKVGVAAYSMTLDITKAKNNLKYVPKVSTDQALAEFSKWWLDK